MLFIIARRIAASWLGFLAIGIFITAIAGFLHGRLHDAALLAINEMIAPNAIAILVVCSFFATGVVTLILGRPTQASSPAHVAIFHWFARRPADFVLNFCAPMFWFFVGVTVTLACFIPFWETAVLLTFAIGLAVLAGVSALYVEIVASSGLGRLGRLFRDGRLIGLFMVLCAIYMVTLLPVSPAMRGH